jgi:hypothetical protein
MSPKEMGGLGSVIMYVFAAALGDWVSRADSSWRWAIETFLEWTKFWIMCTIQLCIYS